MLKNKNMKLVCESLEEFKPNELELLKEQYPNLTFNMDPHPTFKGSFRCNVYEGETYLGGIKGACNYNQAIEFFKNVAKSTEEGKI
jgi:hypothetical protein